MGFEHLHVASAYSSHFGVSWPAELAAAAKAQGAQTLACTDRDGLYGAVKHMAACLKEGLAPVLGADLASSTGGRVLVLTRTSCPEFLRAPGPYSSPAGTWGMSRLSAPWEAEKTQESQGAQEPQCTRKTQDSREAPGSQETEGTYAALCRLVSACHSRGSRHKPQVETEDLQRLSRCAGTAQLTVLLGPDSDVGRLLQQRQYEQARQALRRWVSELGRDIVIGELVSQFAAPGKPLSTAHAVRMYRLCQEEGVPTVLSNAVRYAAPDGAVTAEIVDAARHLSPFADVPVPQPNGQAWLKNEPEMKEVAREIMRAAGEGAMGVATLLRRTAQLAEASAIDPQRDAGWKQPRVPELSALGIDSDPTIELWSRCRQQAHIAAGRRDMNGRLITEERVHDLLDHELKIITELGFEGYFLTVAEVASMIRRAGLRVSARGSGASSMVNHVLGISGVNPIEHDLVFERFLSRDRTTLPDIDLDVESAERHRIYRDIFKAFGHSRVSLMSMQNSYQARGAVRDAGRALGLEEDSVGEIAGSIWRYSASSLREALASKPELRETARRVESDEQLDLLVDLTARLDRLPRHISMHPCGVLLSDLSLLDRTPVQASGMGLPMSQFDKHDMDNMGFIKLDVLGVRMQSAIAHTLREVQRIHTDPQSIREAGRHPKSADYIRDNGLIDIDSVPLDDPMTFDLIRSTHTLGCFQIESPGQRELVGKLEPRVFNDLIIDISLFRPGPMQSNMVKPYLENRHGFAEENYPHPRLREALKETHGVTVFHEQVLRVFDEMTGCGLAQADVYRRLLGSREAEPLVEALFRAAAAERGFTQEAIDVVWQTLHGFGSFGFCKAHGAAFAVPTYQSAWLKAHHPEAFLAGIWEHDPGMYPKRLLVAEARRMGIPILPIDVNASDTSYRVERTPDGRLGIRLALAEIRGVSSAELKRLAANAPYTSISDVRDRARLSRRSMVTLASVGAFESLSRSGRRADVVAHLGAIASASAPSSAGQKARAQVLEGQRSFDFGDLEQDLLPESHPEQSPEQRVRTELTLLSVDVSDHLMSSYEPLLRRLGTSKASELLGLRSGTEVLVAGVRVATQTPPMRGGKRVVFISVDDGTGCIDTTFFSDAQEQAGPLLFGARMLLIRGRTRRTGARGISLQALAAWDLTAVAEASAAGDGSLERLLQEARAAERYAPHKRETAQVEGPVERAVVGNGSR